MNIISWRPPFLCPILRIYCDRSEVLCTARFPLAKAGEGNRIWKRQDEWKEWKSGWVKWTTALRKLLMVVWNGQISELDDIPCSKLRKSGKISRIRRDRSQRIIWAIVFFAKIEREASVIHTNSALLWWTYLPDFPNFEHGFNTKNSFLIAYYLTVLFLHKNYYQHRIIAFFRTKFIQFSSWT